MRRTVAVSVFSIVALLGSLTAWADYSAPGGTFTDEDGNAHEGAIEAIAGAGITNGCNLGNYLYCPAGSVTRGQIAAFLDRTLTLGPASKDYFTDDNNSIFQDSINRVAEAGITKGCSATQYCPDRIMSREEMAALLVRAFAFPAASQDYFTDDDGTFFEADINALAAAGVTLGCATGKYCPLGSVRRDEMASFLTRSDTSLTSLTPPPPVRVSVASVTDGDTIRVVLSGVNEPLRLIGIDTPESGQTCFDEATNAMKALVSGKVVRIDKDVSERDQYSRLLRYVFLTNGTFVNAEMVRQGWAAATDYPPDSTWAGLFAQFQTQAKAAGKGIWGTNCGQTQPPKCDPSYPTVCIPPPPPDLDCGDISYRNFKVLQPDPHRFDGDKDGIGCET